MTTTPTRHDEPDEGAVVGSPEPDGDRVGAAPEPEPAAPSRRRGAWATAGVVALYVALAAACYAPVWSDPARRFIYDGDQVQSVWSMAWAPYAILHGHNPFFTTALNYPFGANLLVITSILVPALVAAPITLVAGPIAAYNLMLVVALASSATAAYALARRLTSWRPAALIAGLVYGFSPYEIAQGSGHLNLTCVPLPPLILLATYDLVSGRARRRLRTGALLGLMVGLQFFVSSELLVDTVVVGAGLVVLAAVVHWRELPARLAASLPGAAGAGGLAAALLAYPVWFDVRGPGHITGPLQLVPQAYRSDLLALVVPDVFQRLSPATLAATGNAFSHSPVENGAYLGVTMVLVLGAGLVWLRREPLARWLAAGGLWAFVLSLGTGLVIKSPPPATASGFPLPERLLTKVSLLANIIPSRFSFLTDLFAALLLALVLDRLHTRLGERRGRPARHGAARRGRRARRATPGWLVPLAVAAVALVPLVPAVPYPGIETLRVPAAGTLASFERYAPGTAVLTYPYPEVVDPGPAAVDAVDFLRVRLVGGYLLVPGPDGRVAFGPLGYGRATPVFDELVALGNGDPPPRRAASQAAVRHDLAVWHVSVIVAQPGQGPNPAQATSTLEWLFGPPDRTGGGTLVWTRVPR